MVRAIFLIFIYFSNSLIFANLDKAKDAYSRKEFEKAITYFRQYNESNPSSGTGYVYLGYIYEFKKEYPKSIEMFKIAVQKNITKENKISSYMKIVLYYNYYQKWDQVVKYSNILLKLDPTLENIEKIRAKAEINAINSPSSKTEKKEETEEKKNTIEYYEKLLEKYPDNESYLWSLTQLYYTKQNYNKAEILLEKLILKKPSDKNYLYKQALTKLKINKNGEALELFIKLESLLKESDKELLNHVIPYLAKLNYEKNDYQKALVYYKKNYEFDQSNTIVLGLIRTNYNLKNYSDVLTIISSNKFSDNLIEIKMYEALSYSSLNQKMKTKNTLFEFSKLLEEKYPAFNFPEKYGEGVFKTAILLTKTKSFEKSTKYFQNVESKYSDFKEFNFYFGKSLYLTNSYEKAISYLLKIQDSASTFYLLSKCYLKLNNNEKVKEYLKLAITKNPDFWAKTEKSKVFETVLKDPSFNEFFQSLKPNASSTEPTQKSSNSETKVP